MKKQRFKMSKELYHKLTKSERIGYKLIGLKAQIEELRSHLLPSGIAYDKESVQSSPDDKIAKVVMEIEELQEEYSALQLKQADAIKETREFINKLSDPKQIVIMELSYIAHLNHKEIADEIKYSREWVTSKYHEAIEILDRILKNTENTQNTQNTEYTE